MIVFFMFIDLPPKQSLGINESNSHHCPKNFYVSRTSCFHYQQPEVPNQDVKLPKTAKNKKRLQSMQAFPG
jgi:hypothetical protein